LAGDVLVQEYGRYFGMPTCCLRGGCLTGPNHSGVELHGFLSYLVKCNLEGREYTVFGYRGKQVRDNIHSEDVAAFMHAFYASPRCGAVYNLGGGKPNSCSILEAFAMAEVPLNDTTNAFKAYRREVIEGCPPLISPHFNLTIELPLKAIVRGFSWTVIPITWRNRRTGEPKLKIREMGSRYLFICLYVWLEKYFSRGDYKAKRPDAPRLKPDAGQ
jgi:hypothetical protein